jgi:hypothetical protein
MMDSARTPRVISRFRARSNSPTHKKKGRPKSPLSFQASNQVQVITPFVMSQTFAVCVWLAVALHDGGGPATAVTMTVTFCDGLKP